MQIYRVFDGHPKPNPVVSLVECAEYQVEVDAEAVFFAGRELEPVRGAETRWHLKTPFAVGKGTFTIHKDGEAYTQSVVIRADPKKIESKQLWEQMLEDLLHWSESIIGHQGIRGMGINSGPLQHYLLLEGLIPLLRKFQMALTHLFEQLREQTIYPNQQIRITNLRAPYPLRQIIQQPVVAAYLEGHGVDDVPVIDTLRPEQTFNHPVNRYIRWLVEQVLRYLEMSIRELRPSSEAKDSSENVWRRTRADVLEEEQINIQRLFRRSPLSQIPASPLKGGAFLVILNDPLYAAVHKIGRLLCGQSLTVQQTEYIASSARSFDIYELWCFQRVVCELSRSFGVQPTYQYTDQTSNSAEWGMSADFVTEDVNCTVEFNANFESRFPTFPMGATATRRYSTMTNQRPDIVIYHTDNLTGRKCWMILDAKYRTTKRNLTDAFKSAFTYNQTLVDPAYGGKPKGSFLLAPKVLPETVQWFNNDFIQFYPYGAIEYRPKQDLVKISILLSHLLSV